jgi:hypothetical protein
MSPTQRAVHAIAKTLIPLFLAEDQDKAAARAAALAALAAYQPETLTDYLAAARAIAFSLGAIAATGTALDAELPARQQLQCLTRANSFARLAQKAEAALEKARKHRPANTTPRAPEPELPFALPATPEEEDAMLLAFINQTRAELQGMQHELRAAEQQAAASQTAVICSAEAAAQAPSARNHQPQNSPAPTHPAGTR